MNSTIGMLDTEKLHLNTSLSTLAFKRCQNFSLQTTDIAVAVTLYSLIAFGGSFGNMVVVLVIRRTPNLRTVCGVLIANLAMADLLVTAIAVPMVISGLPYGIVPQCSFKASSSALILIGRCSTTASLLTLAALSVDRCWAIASPLSHKLKMTSSKMKVILAFIWLASPIIPALEVFSRVQKQILIRLQTAGVSACSVAIVMGGIITFMKVRRKSSKIRNLCENQGKSQTSADLSERDKQVAKTIALIVVLFSLCWVPILAISVIFSDPGGYTRLHFWTGLLGLANSALNPCIYFYRQRNYRRAFKELVRPPLLSIAVTRNG